MRQHRCRSPEQALRLPRHQPHAAAKLLLLHPSSQHLCQGCAGPPAAPGLCHACCWLEKMLLAATHMRRPRSSAPPKLPLRIQAATAGLPPLLLSSIAKQCSPMQPGSTSRAGSKRTSGGGGGRGGSRRLNGGCDSRGSHVFLFCFDSCSRAAARHSAWSASPVQRGCASAPPGRAAPAPAAGPGRAAAGPRALPRRSRVRCCSQGRAPLLAGRPCPGSSVACRWRRLAPLPRQMGAPPRPGQARAAPAPRRTSAADAQEGGGGGVLFFWAGR